MAEIILWNTQGSSDKIWGLTEYEGRPISFWGRRGNELTFKVLDSQYAADKARREKLGRGYDLSSFDEMESLAPGFREKFDEMFNFCILADGFHRFTGF